MKNLEILKNKILPDQKTAESVFKKSKLNGQTTVFTNGCFDIIHKGHVEYLAKAADCGDILMVAVNTDDSVRSQGKGEERPINKEADRLKILAALLFVDYVVLFNDDTPLELIKQVKPDVLVKGADYNPHQTDKKHKEYIVGREDVLKNGGEVKTIDLVEGYSTTGLVERLKG